MNKKSIITMMLALVTMAGQAQTKTATVTGYSPALKDGTLVLAGTGTIGNVVDTVQAGRFAFTLPVEELTEGFLGLMGEGCPNFNLTLFLRPGVTVKLTGNDCFYPLWKVESPLSEQQTQSRITEYCRDVVTELMQMDLDKKPWEEREIVEMKWMKQRMDILPSLPVDAATIRALWGISMTAKRFTTMSIHHDFCRWVMKLLMPNSLICKDRNTIYLKPFPMTNTYCSTSGASVVVLA